MADAASAHSADGAGHWSHSFVGAEWGEESSSHPPAAVVYATSCCEFAPLTCDQVKFGHSTRSILAVAMFLILLVKKVPKPVWGVLLAVNLVPVFDELMMEGVHVQHIDKPDSALGTNTALAMVFFPFVIDFHAHPPRACGNRTLVLESPTELHHSPVRLFRPIKICISSVPVVVFCFRLHLSFLFRASF